MVRNIKAGILTICLLGSCAPAQASITDTILSFAQQQRFALAIGATYLGLGTVYAALIYRNNCRWQNYQKYQNLRNKLAKVSQELVNCKAWSDEHVIPTFDYLKIEPAILSNPATWACYISAMNTYQVSMFGHSGNTTQQTLHELNVHAEYGAKLFEIYKQLFKNIEELASRLNNNYYGQLISDEDRSAHSYCLTMIPLYLNKLAFAKQVITTRGTDFNQAQAAVINEPCSPCSNCCNCCASCHA